MALCRLARSRRFYEGLLGFQFWWELELPDEGTAQLLQLDGPNGVRATYLVRDGFVLELIDFSTRDAQVPERPIRGRQDRGRCKTRRRPLEWKA